MTANLVAPRLGPQARADETGIVKAYDQIVVSYTYTDVIDADSAILLDTDGSELVENASSHYRAATTGDL